MVTLPRCLARNQPCQWLRLRNLRVLLQLVWSPRIQDSVCLAATMVAQGRITDKERRECMDTAYLHPSRALLVIEEEDSNDHSILTGRHLGSPGTLSPLSYPFEVESLTSIRFMTHQHSPTLDRFPGQLIFYNISLPAKVLVVFSQKAQFSHLHFET